MTVNFFQRRRLRKRVQHALHDARHAIHMREDVAGAEELDALKRAAARLQEAWGRGEPQASLESAMDDLEKSIGRVLPAKPFAFFREMVEIVAVALAVAMGFRTFFLQPFKIPTGSMQPTLYGITMEPRDGPTWSDRFPCNVVKLALFGRRYIEVRAQASGPVVFRHEYDKERDAYLIYVGSVPHVVFRNMRCFFQVGQDVLKGQLLAAGERVYGDHVFVDKVRYNFARPRRGDIVVFDTTHIDHPQIRPNNFYIKRLAGLPGETVSIEPPFLVIDGSRITSPYPFARILHEREKGYRGYALARLDQSLRKPFLASPEDRLTLGPREYLLLGDNSPHSLDGRYFGPVRAPDLIGPALAVYWPLSPRWGPVR